MTMEIKLNQPVPEPVMSEQRDQKLRKACQEFESVFTYHLLRSMRATIDKSGLLDGGQGEEIYESLMDQEIAKNALKWGPNSLAQALYGQLKKQDLGGAEGTSDPGRPEIPVQSVISSGFGWRKDPFSGENKFHYGVDFPAHTGTPVKAALDGRVLASGYQEGYGNMVLLDHGKGFTTLYAHNQENNVREGAWVKKGAPIAQVGSSGQSTGPHLHFEARKNGQYLNPIDFLRSDKPL